MKFGRWIFASVANCSLKVGETRGVKFYRARIILVVGEKPQNSAPLENPQDLAQKFRLHHPPYLVAALRPRIRKENVNIIRARVGQSTKGISAVTVNRPLRFQAQAERSFSAPFRRAPAAAPHRESSRRDIFAPSRQETVRYDIPHQSQEAGNRVPANRQEDRSGGASAKGVNVRSTACKCTMLCENFTKGGGRSIQIEQLAAALAPLYAHRAREFWIVHQVTHPLC